LDIARAFLAMREEIIERQTIELDLEDHEMLARHQQNRKRCMKAAGLFASLRLFDLCLFQVPFSDLTPLSYLPSLRVLALSGTQVRELSPLTSLSDLMILSLDNTPVDDVTPLSGLTNLRTLDLRNTLVTDLSPLSGLTTLRQLDLTRGQADQAPLQALVGAGLQIRD